MRVFPVDSDDERDARRPSRRPIAIITSTPHQNEDTARSTQAQDVEQEEEGEGEEAPPSPLSPPPSSSASSSSLLALLPQRVPALSLDALCAVMDDTLAQLRTFRLSGRTVSSGARCLGWQDRWLVDGTGVKFQLRKQFASATARDLCAKTWRWLADPHHVLRKFHAASTPSSARTLQRVNEDLEIAVHDALSADGRQVLRCVYVLCRMRTPRGFIICVRSFNPWASSTVEADALGRDVLFANVLGWFRFDTGRGGGTQQDNESGGFTSSSSGYSSSSEGEIERRRGAPGVRVEYAGMVDFGDEAALFTLANASLWMALQWESLVVAPLFNVQACG